MKNKPKYQWILHHTRSTDRVFFGPFESLAEIDEMYDTIPHAEHIHCSIELLINPFVCPKEQWWYNPMDNQMISENPELFIRKEEKVK